MIEYRDNCVGCHPEKGCKGNSCENRNVETWICDRCHEEVDRGDLWEYDGYNLCEECCVEKLFEGLERVRVGE
jgi:hypothetical protein